MFVFSQSPVCNKQNVCVLFDLENYDEIKNYYTENMLWKSEEDGKIIFSKGSETTGPIYYFIFDKAKSQKKRLTETELKRIGIFSFEKFERDFVKNKKNGLVVSVLEITKDRKIYLYNNVEWNKTNYIE